MDALELLKSDHDKVNAIFQRFELGGNSMQFQQLFKQLEQELTVHTTIEEQIFYPAVGKFPELSSLIKDAYKDHAEAKAALAKLGNMDNTTTEWSQTITKLMHDIQSHVKEEEGTLFPRVRQMMSEQQLMQLGQELMQAKGKATNMAANAQEAVQPFQSGQSQYQ